MLGLMAMCKRFSRPPSELLHVDEPFAAYCIDEAVSYAMCRIDEDGRLPHAFDRTLALSGGELASHYHNMKGVRIDDLRRNDSRVSDT